MLFTINTLLIVGLEVPIITATGALAESTLAGHTGAFCSRSGSVRSD